MFKMIQCYLLVATAVDPSIRDRCSRVILESTEAISVTWSGHGTRFAGESRRPCRESLFRSRRTTFGSVSLPLAIFPWLTGTWNGTGIPSDGNSYFDRHDEIESNDVTANNDTDMTREGTERNAVQLTSRCDNGRGERRDATVSSNEHGATIFLRRKSRPRRFPRDTLFFFVPDPFGGEFHSRKFFKVPR